MEEFPLSPGAFEDAFQMVDRLKPEEAAALLRERLREDPSDATAAAALGMALARLGDTQAAVETVERAHYQRPGDAVLLLHYGLVLLQVGRLPEARLRFEAALRLDPSCEPARRQLAELSGESAGPEPGEPEDSRRSSAVRLRPGPSPATGKPPEPELPGLPPGPFRRPPPDLRMPPEEQEEGGWGPEPPPGLLALVRATLYLWGQQPLAWLSMLAVPNALAAALVPAGMGRQWLAVLVWTAAFGMGLAPLVMAMAGQWVQGRPFGESWRGAPSRLGRAAGVMLPLLFLTLGGFGALLAIRTPFPGAVLLMGSLLLTAPLHALLAPALLLATTEGAGCLAALRTAVLLAGPRTWLHLLLLVTVECLAGLLLLGVGWGFFVTLEATGESMHRVMQFAALTVVESLWAALIVISGMDALAVSGEGEPEPKEAEPEATALARS